MDETEAERTKLTGTNEEEYRRTKEDRNAIAMQICYNSPPLSIVGLRRVFLDRAFRPRFFDTYC
jgi:hypothetical protein